jgi:hypothetical protein
LQGPVAKISGWALKAVRKRYWMQWIRAPAWNRYLKPLICSGKNNIHSSFFIQFGYPGETKEDIVKTIDMINSLLPYEIGISVSYPLPGTVFYENVKAQLQEKTNWTDSDELALMFRIPMPRLFISSFTGTYTRVTANTWLLKR